MQGYITLPPPDNSGNPSPEELQAMMRGGEGDFTGPPPVANSDARDLMREDDGNVVHLKERSMTRRSNLRVLTQARKRCPTCGRVKNCCCASGKRTGYAASLDA